MSATLPLRRLGRTLGLTAARGQDQKRRPTIGSHSARRTATNPGVDCIRKIEACAAVGECVRDLCRAVRAGGGLLAGMARDAPEPPIDVPGASGDAAADGSELLGGFGRSSVTLSCGCDRGDWPAGYGTAERRLTERRLRGDARDDSALDALAELLAPRLASRLPGQHEPVGRRERRGGVPRDDAGACVRPSPAEKAFASAPRAPAAVPPDALDRHLAA